MTVLIILAVGTLNLVCFFVGAKVGQTAAKGEKIEAPSFNPMQKIREAQSRKQAKKERNRVETILQNIEVYDGTSAGQKEVPKG
jgi:hypothetical protein